MAAAALVTALLLGSWFTARAVSGTTEANPDATRTAVRTPASPTSSTPLPGPGPSSTPTPTPSAEPAPTPTPTPTPTSEPGAAGARVRFAPTAFQISTAALPDLNAVAVHLKRHRAALATVIGFPDRTGPGAGEATAWSRAHAIKDYLVGRGVPAAQVTHTIGARAGATQPGGDVLGAWVLVERMD